MFPDNIKWYNDSLKQAAEAQCGDDHECLFDVASTSDLSVGLVTKDISIQLVNETKALGKYLKMEWSDMIFIVCLQSTPGKSNLQGKLKKLRVIGN